MTPSGVALVEASDADFGWLLGEPRSVGARLRVPPGGVDEPGVLRHVRRLTARLLERDARTSWMIVDGDEVVGLCGFKDVPSALAEVEIGYGVATARRRRGYAAAAVALMVARARRDPAIAAVIAETAIGNTASQGVLRKNGFEPVARRFDPEDGEVVVWRIAVSA